MGNTVIETTEAGTITYDISVVEELIERAKSGQRICINELKLVVESLNSKQMLLLVNMAMSTIYDLKKMVDSSFTQEHIDLASQILWMEKIAKDNGREEGQNDAEGVA